MTKIDYDFCRLAVDKAKLCPVNAAHSNPPPRVAIVIAEGGQLIGWAAKGVGGQRFVDGVLQDFAASGADHAEQLLLDQVGSAHFASATAYVTLEPCTKRRAGASCAERLVAAGLRRVYVANCDPNPDVGGLAWRLFHQAGVAVLDFPGELRNEARRDNDPFFAKFTHSQREQGTAAFDHEMGGGVRTLGPLGREFRTRWTNRGRGSIYALDYDHNVAVAKHCAEFGHIDDPGRWFEDAHYTKPVDVGQIVIFKNNHGFALVKIVEVCPKTDTTNAELRFAYQLRYA